MIMLLQIYNGELYNTDPVISASDGDTLNQTIEFRLDDSE